MKLTKETLKRIIKEELQVTLREGGELSPLADKILNFMKDRFFDENKFSIDPSELEKRFGAGTKEALDELTSHPMAELFYDDEDNYYYIDPDSYRA